MLAKPAKGDQHDGTEQRCAKAKHDAGSGPAFSIRFQNNHRAEKPDGNRGPAPPSHPFPQNQRRQQRHKQRECLEQHHGL